MVGVAFFVIFVIPTVVMWIIAVNWHRSQQRKALVPRIPLDAFVVVYEAYRRPQRVTFDYPLPDGQWNRMVRSVGFGPTTGSGFLGDVNPGDKFTVYVNPENPYDVSLGRSNPAHVFTYLFYGIASMLTVFVLTFFVIAAF